MLCQLADDVINVFPGVIQATAQEQKAGDDEQPS
jgi:hypothetical protein